MKYRESRISAHHNYLVNGMPTPGFALGDPRSEDGFFFLADVVLPGESTPRISCRIVSKSLGLVAEINWNRIRKNPGGCVRRFIPGGFRIQGPAGEALLEVRTESLANGFLTRIRADLSNKNGDLRMQPMGDSVLVHGDADLALERPFDI
jgi:hypothetical protein